MSLLRSFHFNLRYCTLEITARLGDDPLNSGTPGRLWRWGVAMTAEVNRNGTCCWKWSIKTLPDVTEELWVIASGHFFPPWSPVAPVRLGVISLWFTVTQDQSGYLFIGQREQSYETVQQNYFADIYFTPFIRWEFKAACCRLIVCMVMLRWNQSDCLGAPSLHSFKEEYGTYGPLGGMDGSLQSEWEDTSTRGSPSVTVSSLAKMNS